MRSASSVALAQVTEAIERRGCRLRFAQDLEQVFDGEMSEARCRRIVVQNYVGFATYQAFILGDWILVRDCFALSLFIHVCLMTPLLFLTNWIMSLRPAAWLREGVLAFGIVTTTAAILVLMLLSRSPLRTSEHISIVLVILFATMVQRIRFQFALTACAASLALYVAALSQLTEGAPWERKAIAAAVFFGVVLFSLIGCYNLEREQRSNFLLRLRDRLRHRELESLSRRDALTGMSNRRALDETLAHHASSREPARSMAVLLFDIDFFKAYNDANGHLAGDLCLKRVAAIIAAGVRRGADDVYRFGGEEFLVVLDDADATRARAAAERIRSDVAAAAIARGGGLDAQVTLSVGVASAVLNAGDTVLGLVAEADLALYAAKRAGRNQVHVAGAPPAALAA